MQESEPETTYRNRPVDRGLASLGWDGPYVGVRWRRWRPPPTLQRAVFEAVLPLLREAPGNVVEERSRGRIKKWSCWIAGAEDIDFPHARQVVFIRREVFEISGDRISKENALILTSRKPAEMTAADASRHTRNHWGIENKSHYVRDTVYWEDHGRA